MVSLMKECYARNHRQEDEVLNQKLNERRHRDEQPEQVASCRGKTLSQQQMKQQNRTNHQTGLAR